MARQLKYEAGGDPTAHGPVPELANEPTSPRDGNEFPDVPPANRVDSTTHPRPPDQPDRDRFAERLGLKRLGLRGRGSAATEGEPRRYEETGRSEAGDRAIVIVRRGILMTRSVAATTLFAFAATSVRLADLLEPAEQRTDGPTTRDGS